MGAYENTGLWKRSLGQSDKLNEPSIIKLRSAYLDFREKAFALTAQISKAIPNLTIHDGTHLDALWETADIIVGEDYPLNPLEAFVLGGAILLHDAALCFEAYEGGQEGLRSTMEWKDSYSAIRQENEGLDESLVLAEADFAALRHLHAKQAELLAEVGWDLPSGEKIYLVEDVSLRTRYGSLIGRIAASHHWSIEDLEKLGHQVNAPGSLPSDWRVDPIKIACILRCADAAHLDDRRAPDFLYALLKRQGISANHWKAQNWMARADLDQSDQSRKSLLFTSNRDFCVSDADAWWVAYDAISLVDAEIRSSNALLSSRSMRAVSPPFRINNVVGANDPESLSHYVRCSGWKPCSARIHVSNLAQLVKKLGGAELYGNTDPLGVAIRELVQNSRDAIAARRIFDSQFEGKICIELVESHPGGYSIRISDDGVGMSERVLTGPLLDFGVSFWTSNLALEEFPGLRSSNFRPVGKFGIGFYAIFMVADNVSVSSRRWNEGHGDIRSLNFPAGLTLRPIFTSGKPDAFPSSASTAVNLFLKNDVVSAEGAKIRRNRLGESDFYVQFEDYLASLVCGLDVEIEYRTRGAKSVIHIPIQNVVTLEQRTKWLGKLSYAEYEGAFATWEKIEKIANRLRYVDDENPTFGLAALSDTVHRNLTFLNVDTVGGLATTVHNRSGEYYFGFMDFYPKSAKRESGEGKRALHSKLEAWAKGQIELLQSEGMDDAARAAVTLSLAGLGLDPTDVFTVLIKIGGQMRYVDLPELLKICETSGIAVIEGGIEDHIDTWTSVSDSGKVPVFVPMANGNFLSLKRKEEMPEEPNSFLGCLDRYARGRGQRLQYRKTPNIGKSFFGPVHLIVISIGT
ncbi:ATP-binding protein [Achromobacter spanius]|uniref:HD domain-containing protein n=1 Tax=Achromobacter spanius TaxID=217203 RepID=UPI00222707C4|nr:ATP-binding protein [Achromobacter spanius]MCW3154844.1 ATP-binding protein [Achromobacter spanius]